jgi:hypothetical protein
MLGGKFRWVCCKVGRIRGGLIDSWGEDLEGKDGLRGGREG